MQKKKRHDLKTLEKNAFWEKNILCRLFVLRYHINCKKLKNIFYIIIEVDIK